MVVLSTLRLPCLRTALKSQWLWQVYFSIGDWLYMTTWEAAGPDHLTVSLTIMGSCHLNIDGIKWFLHSFSAMQIHCVLKTIKLLALSTCWGGEWADLVHGWVQWQLVDPARTEEKQHSSALSGSGWSEWVFGRLIHPLRGVRVTHLNPSNYAYSI